MSQDRPSTKVHAAPGGGSSLGYLFGGGSNWGQLQGFKPYEVCFFLLISLKFVGKLEYFHLYDCQA